MKRICTYRFAIFIIIIIMAAGLTACGSKKDNSSTAYTSTDGQSLDWPAVTPDNGASITDGPLGPDMPQSSSGLSEALKVRGKTIYLGESADSVIKSLGSPNRILNTEYNFEYYVYNNDYSRLLFVAVKDSKVAGYYTDSKDFDYKGITLGAELGTVNKDLSTNFSMSEVINYGSDNYTLNIFMDKLDTRKVTGLLLMSKDVKQGSFTDEALRSNELIVFDLTNSMRAINGVPVLSWSTSAANASRKHSKDMAENNYFDHISQDGSTPGDRLGDEGVYYTSIAENIIGGYKTAILSCNAWYNSKDHRNNMLNSNYKYMGAGIAYKADSNYKTYITQVFYR